MDDQILHFNDYLKSLFNYQIVITPKSISFIICILVALLIVSIRSLKKIRVLNQEYLYDDNIQTLKKQKLRNRVREEGGGDGQVDKVHIVDENDEQEPREAEDEQEEHFDIRSSKDGFDHLNSSNNSNISNKSTSTSPGSSTSNSTIYKKTHVKRGSFGGSFSFSENQRKQVMEAMRQKSIDKRRRDILKAPMLEELEKTKKLNEPPQFKRNPTIRPKAYSSTSTALFKDINSPKSAVDNNLNSSTVSRIKSESDFGQIFPSSHINSRNYIPSNLYNYKDTSGSSSSHGRIDIDIDEQSLIPFEEYLNKYSPTKTTLTSTSYNNCQQEPEDSGTGNDSCDPNNNNNTNNRSKLLASNYNQDGVTEENLENISLRFASNSINLRNSDNSNDGIEGNNILNNSNNNNNNNSNSPVVNKNPNSFKDEIDELYSQRKNKKTVTISTLLGNEGKPSPFLPGFEMSSSLSKNSTLTEEDEEDYCGSDIDGEDFSSVNIDYNERFQEIMENLRNIDCNSYQVDKIRVNNQFIALTQDFVYASSTFGKVIISERYLPNNEKTIPPIDIGGLAGGDKFIVHGILFKFAIDKESFYGSDYASMCVGGHELKGLINVFNCNVNNLSLPLMALVDYRGFRVIAMSILPINKDSIYYGSNDYGRTIHNDDPYLSDKVKEVSQLLNIKSHNCGESGTFLHSPADLEGHRGFDGRYYLLDFARLFPAEAPRKSIRMGHLYRLLRPEFVRNYKNSLCSDAFSRFIKGHNEDVHNNEVVEATEYLLNTTIFEVSEELNMLEIDIQNVYSIPLTERLHKSGINIRYLGHVRQHCKSLDMKSLIFIEMCARVIKQQLRQKLRFKMAKAKIPLEAPYRRLIIAYLNRILGISDRSDLFWNERIKKYLIKKFDKCLFPDEVEGNSLILALSSFSDHNIDGKYLLFKRIQKMTGLKFTNRINEEFLQRPNCWLQRGNSPLDINDLDEIGIRVKYVPFMNVAQGYLFKVKGEVLFQSDPIAAKRFFNMSLERLSTALETDPNNANTLCTMAEVWSHLGFGYEQNLSEIQLNRNNEYISKAYEYFQRAIFANPNHTDSLFKFAQLLERCGEYEIAEDYYLSSLHTNSNNIACLIEYGNFLLTIREDAPSAEHFYERGKQNDHYLSKQRDEKELKNKINMRSSSGLLKVKQNSSSNNIFDDYNISGSNNSSLDSISIRDTYATPNIKPNHTTSPTSPRGLSNSNNPININSVIDSPLIHSRKFINLNI